ncbi:MAG TPA: amino acid adenylation domain-containing protein, partial [Longimicrobiaceae bacterium]|nr:amino acid adenylation domain-containing protein [Longimicrobiaceae bacterium]
MFMTLLAGWAAVLSRLSGQEDLVVGTPTANRGRREIEGLIGFFVNTLALRVDLSGAPTVGELLERVRERALEAQQNQDVPFEQVVEAVQPARSLAHSPLFQVMFAWQTAPGDELELPGLGVEAMDRSAERVSAHFDLSLGLAESRGRLVGWVQYATSLYDGATVERYLGYLRRVLEEMAAGPERRLAGLEMLPDAERRQVVEAWNATAAEYPRGLCVHQLFERQVERTPDAVALVFEDEQVCYSELNRRANRLAHHLVGLGVGPEARVAVCVERSVEMVVALLAVLKAGGAYVPLDPEYPRERLAYMLHDSAPQVLLTQTSLAGQVAGLGAPVLSLDTDASSWAARPETNPRRPDLTPEHLVYVIYTSGSTGRPKGVMVRHAGLTNYVCYACYRYADAGAVTFPLHSSLAFDLTVTSIYVPLVTGGSIAVVGGQGTGRSALEMIAASGAEAVKLTPAHLATLTQQDLTGLRLRRMVVGGEELSQSLARAIHDRSAGRVEIYNEYGPTEATVGCVVHRADPAEAGASVPIGRPIANTAVYVLDGPGSPVAVGVAGELYLAGVQVARGYLGRPELTAERFVPDPFGAEAGGRLYRTGDLARWRADGVLEFLGRNDQQVKVRGYRIELGEIEARLLEHLELRETVVVAREDTPGDRRLVAYYVAREAIRAESLRGHLQERLPEHMVPAAYVHLEALPLTPNGKVDRRALPAPEGDAYARRGYEAPQGEVEQALAEIWAEVLRLERVGRWDHFFELGGHSLLAVQVVSRLRQRLGVEVPLAEVFRLPVVAEYARAVAAAARADLPPIEPAERTAPLPLSFAQQRLWFLEQMGGLGSAYHVRRRLRLRGELDRGALVRALDRIVARHEALRTTFSLAGGEPVQRIAPLGESRFHLVEHDLGGQADAEEELRRL